MQVRLLSILAAGLLIAADTPKQPAKKAVDKPKDDARLDAVLQDWERATTHLRDMHCQFVMTTEDRTFGDKTTAHGELFFKNPDLLRVDVKNDKGELQQICCGPRPTSAGTISSRATNY